MTDHACRSCGSPLAADQRYCLQCGNRVAEARVPFLDILGSERPVAATTTTTVTERRSRWSIAHMSTNAAAVAGVACLLLALGVGVLIGNAGGNTGDTPATPQVISVGGAAPAAATPAPTSTVADTGATNTSTPSKSKAKKSSSSSASAPAHQTKATNKSLKSLDSTSGADYQKKASKLPKTVGTGGKAPPKDNKPAGGGGSFQEIG